MRKPARRGGSREPLLPDLGGRVVIEEQRTSGVFEFARTAPYNGRVLGQEG